MDLKTIETEIARLDALIAPLANRPFEAGQYVPPYDELGIREETQAFVRQILEHYQRASDVDRTRLRGFFDKYKSFAWSADPGIVRGTQEELRSELLLFCLHDQGRDPRDARMWLNELQNYATENSLDLAAALREAAKTASREDRYGWGSTHGWLLALAT